MMMATGPSSSSWSAARHGCPLELRDGDWCFFVVMAGPVPATHVFTRGPKDVDGRHKGGHDDIKWPTSIPWKFHRTGVPQGRP
jgi:hypothetical protein